MAKRVFFLKAVKIPVKNINKNKAIRLGEAHEKGNYLEFKKAKKKGIYNGYDAVASEMDLYNNQVGVTIGLQYPEADEEELKQIIIEQQPLAGFLQKFGHSRA